MAEPGHSEQPLGGEGAEHAWGTRPSVPRLRLPATVDTVPDGARVTVIVRGELDLDTGQQLRPDLLRALSGSADGVDLYLGEVTFCDCSGINLMLDLRRLALRDGKTVTVLSSSLAVDRMFGLTGTRDLFEPSEPSEPSGQETGAEAVAEAAAAAAKQPGTTPPQPTTPETDPQPPATPPIPDHVSECWPEEQLQVPPPHESPHLPPLVLPQKPPHVAEPEPPPHPGAAAATATPQAPPPGVT